MKHNQTRDEGNAVSRWLVSLIPGLSFALAGFPKLGIFVGSVQMMFWIMAWPFAVPLQLIVLLTGVDLLRKRDTWELWDERAAERIWRRQMDGVLRHEVL